MIDNGARSLAAGAFAIAAFAHGHTYGGAARWIMLALGLYAAAGSILFSITYLRTRSLT